MKYIIYYRIKDLLIQVCPDEMIPTNNFLNKSKLNSLSHGSKVSSKEVEYLTGISLNDGHYIYYIEDFGVYFKKFSLISYLSSFLYKRKGGDFVNSVILNFRHHQKEKLLNEFTSPEATLNSTINSLCDYTFSNHCSLWVYHNDLNSFTCAVSSFIDSGIIITNDSNTSLSKGLELKEYELESRPISTDFLLSEKLIPLDLKYLNRLKIKYGDRGVAIASFYSQNDSFKFDSKLGLRLSQFLKSKLTIELEESHEKFEGFTQKLQLNIDKETYSDFANKFLKSLCSEFKYKAANISIFSDTKLDKVFSIGDDEIDPEGLESIEVSLNAELTSIITTPLTSRVCKDFNGPTQDGAVKTIITTPFIVGKITFCLIAINKLGVNGATVCLPSAEDIGLIERATEFLGFATKVYSTYERLQNKNTTQRNFSKVWMHELRTPINTFTLTPDTIKLNIKKLKLDEKLTRKIEHQLDDIKMFGKRLKLLTDTFNFQDLLKAKEIKKISVLQSIIYPIHAISQKYAQVQFNLNVDIAHQSFKGHYVFSDERLINMVLNAIVDNALKYSNEDSEFVLISGSIEQDNFFTIKVSNKGYPIDKGELESIFDELERGKNVKSRKIHGTGIGLYIAKKVMESLGGSVEISSNKPEKIEFSIHIPLREN